MAYLISLTLPQSITQTTSSMVMDVSATLVATTILRWPGLTFSNTLACVNQHKHIVQEQSMTAAAFVASPLHFKGEIQSHNDF